MTAGRVFLLFIAIWAIAIGARVPLSAVVPDAVIKGPAAVSGSFWNGHIDNIPLAGGHMGALTISGNPASVFGLSLGADWSLDSLTMSGHGTASKHLNGTNHLKIAQMTIDLSPYSLSFKSELSLFGQLNISNADIVFDENGQCQEASGQIKTDALQRLGAGMNWASPLLSGPISCQNKALTIALEGENEDSQITANWTFSGTELLSNAIDISTDNAAVLHGLENLGFEKHQEGYRWTYGQ